MRRVGDAAVDDAGVGDSRKPPAKSVVGGWGTYGGRLSHEACFFALSCAVSQLPGWVSDKLAGVATSSML